MDGTDVEIEEYEEIVGNWDQASVREGTTDFRAVSIQDPTTDEQFNSMTRTERPALRPTERSFAGEQNESHSVVVKRCKNICDRMEHAMRFIHSRIWVDRNG